MLPTKGYFQDIDCPYYDSQCGRPYCHFRHKKKLTDTGNDSPKDSEVPTYKPTPKSQLANNRSHIPISYVPDLAFRPERTVRNLQKLNIEKPIYKPTPLSILSSVNKQHAEIADKVNKDVTVSEETKGELKQHTIIDEEYSPVNIAGHIGLSLEYTPTNQANIPSEKNSVNEYTPVGENCLQVEYNPTSSDKQIDEKSDKYYLPSDNKDCNVKYTPTEINFEDFSNEFDMIDEIISDDTGELEKNVLDIVEKVSLEDNNEQQSSNTSQMTSKLQENKDPDSICDIKHHKPDPSKSNSSSQPSKSSSNHHSKKKSKSESSKSTNKKSKHLNESKEKHSSSNKTTEKVKHEDSDSSKHRSSRKDKDHHKDKHKTDTKEKRHSSSSSCSHKSKHKSSDRHKDKEKKHTSTSSSKDKHHKDKHKVKEGKGEKSEDKHSKTKAQNKLESKKEKHNKNDTKHVKTKHKNKVLDVVHQGPDDLDTLDYDFVLDDDDDDTMEECYRIFNEYKPPEAVSSSQISAPSIRRDSESETEVFVGKKRIAHTNSEKITPKIQMPPLHTVTNAAQAMTDRFKLARLAQASNEQKNIMFEMKNISVNHTATSSSKRSAPPSLKAAARSYKIQKTLREAQTNQKPKAASLVDQIISSAQKSNNAVAKFSQRRIAPVANILSIQKAKERIEEIKQKAAESVVKTTAKTVKAGKRMAHVPEFSLSDIPDVLQADKSKLPVNVRTRFLTMIAEECGKLYLTKEDAYTRALNEEFSCYEKCKVLVTYKNSAMLAVNRIRKEHLEREKQGLGRIYSGEDTAKDKVSEFKGKKFFNNIRRYILTDEELDIHGYPKESRIPGKAIIKNRKQVQTMSLEAYQKKCSRCSKIYVVDEDGFAFYEEECLYHPLKKRTLRGEQTYLCCKSNDDIGCVTSHTHVSECPDDSELEGYQTTMVPESNDDPRNFAVYALDCEMCYTTKGLELTRVTIIDSECKTVYDTLVKPLNPIVDYNTRFSGITREQMDRTSTSILQVQANILHLCNSETILIGHSLESDLKALKIVHGNIIDTSVLFPHRLGLPHKRALRALASEYLEKIIQNDISGHDSAEDAITCMELIKWKLKEELKVRGVK